MPRWGFLAIAPLLLLLMGQSESSCALENVDRRPLVKMSTLGLLVFPDDGRDHSKVGLESFVGQEVTTIEHICMHTDKVVCEWTHDPNDKRMFEETGPSPWGHPQTRQSPNELELRARCGQGSTYAGICERWHGNVIPESEAVWGAEAVSMFDIGACSASLSTELFLTEVVSQFQKQSDERLGEQRPPGSEDVVLWLDFVFGLKDSAAPMQAWVDWSTGPNYVELPDGWTVSEVVINSPYRVDGDLGWGWDPDWLGDSVGGRILSGSIQAALLVFGWPGIFFGDCEADRDMTVEFRGSFLATDEGGVGLAINRNQNCGPNGNGPCSWSSIHEWPARPICNNRVKGRIEKEFLDNLYIGLQDPETGNPRCLTCTSDGGSLLPWQLEDGTPVPVEKVTMTPTQIHFVFVDDPITSPYGKNYTELYERGFCNADRTVSTDPVEFYSGGFF